ncbi:hypothetical protein E2C01_011537 [Portunus trituberculatus]|uniref:Uncharacterized protein n=1 Tax=Portunus trituberculatus TaxID=210409 RepID=A0A5B7DBQ1_PORTR|nr:hypothetical protein [Portunus trituberculatus]
MEEEQTTDYGRTSATLDPDSLSTAHRLPPSINTYAKANDERPPVSKPKPSMAAIMLLATSALSSVTILEKRDHIKHNSYNFQGAVQKA